MGRAYCICGFVPAEDEHDCLSETEIEDLLTVVEDTAVGYGAVSIEDKVALALVSVMHLTFAEEIYVLSPSKYDLSNLLTPR